MSIDKNGNPVNVTKGKQGFQEREKGEPNLADSLVADVDMPVDGEPEDTTVTYTFPAFKKNIAIASIDKANARAERAGIEERFEYTINEYEVVEKNTRTGIEEHKPMVELTLDRPTVQHDGWEFVATCTWEEDVMVSRAVPGATLLERPDERKCDVCGKSRTRKDTYVVQRDGVQMQVGSDCLRQFMGIRPAGLWMLDFEPDLREDDDTSYARHYTPPRYSSEQTLAVALAVVKQHGWASRSGSEVGKTPTADRVMDALAGSGGTKEMQDWREQILAESSDYEEDAKSLVAEARSMEGDSDYAINMRAVAAGESVSSRNVGLLVSAIAARQSREQREVEKKVTAKSKHVGQVGDKIADRNVEVTGVSYSDGYYGVTSIVKMVDDEGNVFTWFASGNREFEKGKKYTMKGTIKAHDEFRDVKQTIVTRAKLQPGD